MMRGIDRRSIQNFDWTLLALIGLLAGAGLVNLYSATWIPDGISDEMRRQLLSLAIGATVAVVCTAVDYRHFERFAWPTFGAITIVTAITMSTTANAGHAKRSKWR